MEKIILANAFDLLREYWDPKVVGELNGQQVKLAKMKGEFEWHHHEHEDELFLVFQGELLIELRERTIQLSAGEFFIVPRGVEHRPIAKDEAQVLLLEPASTRKTGDANKCAAP